MLRRLVSLTTLLVLCGVLALSVPAFADRNSQATKTTAPCATVTVVKATALSSATKSEFVRPTWRDGLRFWLRHFLGLPPVQIEAKPPENTEPQKSGGDPKTNNWYRGVLVPDVARDHGGEEIIK